MTRLPKIKSSNITDFNGWTDGLKFDDFNWLIEQAEKAARYEKALLEVRELSKHDCESKYLDKCYVVASRELIKEGLRQQ